MFQEGDGDLCVQFMDCVPVETKGDRDFMLWFLSNLEPMTDIPLGKYLEWVRGSSNVILVNATDTRTIVPLG